MNQHVVSFRNLVVRGATAGLLILAGSAMAGQDDTASLREELDAQRQHLAEQMRLLEAQMVDYQKQVERINDLERRLIEAEAVGDTGTVAQGASTADARVADTSQSTAGNETLSEEEPADQWAPTVADKNQQLLAGEGRSAPYVDEAFTKSVPLFGSSWRLGFGGYAKVDVLHDFSGTGNEQEFVLSTIPVDGNPPPGSYTNLQASETRFHLEARNTNPDFADNSFYVEFDFFDEQNPSSVRLRHAYFRYGRLLAGRTWSLITELRQLPLILDFASGDSILGGRTEQVRYNTVSDDNTFGWAFALENFDDAAIANPHDLSGTSRSNFPRITVGFTKLYDRAIWSTGGAVTQLRFNGTEGQPDSDELAYTFTTAGRLYLDSYKENFLGFGIGYQSGSVTDVATFANGGIPNAVIQLDGGLDVAKSWNTQIGLHWEWNSKLSSNFSYAYARLTRMPGLFDPDLIRTGSSLHANLIYQYNDLITAGIEYMYGNRENVSGRDGDAQRIQFSLFYYF